MDIFPKKALNSTEDYGIIILNFCMVKDNGIRPFL